MSFNTPINKEEETTNLKPPKNYPLFIDQIHGLSLALLSKSLKLQIFWGLIFFICACCGIVNTAIVIIEYINVPTATSITVKLVPSLQLPAITICPKNPDSFDHQSLLLDIKSHLPNIPNNVSLDLIHFWLMGSGLANVEFPSLPNDSYLDQLDGMFKIWSNGQDPKIFYDQIQSKYGYKCEDLFHSCILGGQVRDCCKELFVPRTVVRRGPCFQTKRNVSQTEDGSAGRLVLEIKAPSSITHQFNNFIQPQVIVIVGDNFEYVDESSWIYLDKNVWNQMQFTAKYLELLEHPQDCTKKIIGKDIACLLRNWVTKNLLDPFNCTIPYLIDIPGLPENPKICDPMTIIKNYENIKRELSYSMRNQRCLPGCSRWQYASSLTTTISMEPFNENKPFNFETYFDSLQYEHFKEVETVSISGLISQIGGQLSLFLGLSIVTVFQIAIYSLNLILRLISRFFKFCV